MKIVFDFDDFHYSYPENCLDTIDKLVRECPRIKLSFFTVPLLRDKPLYDNTEWCSRVRHYIETGNICLGVHGTRHTSVEFKYMTYDQALSNLLLSENLFKIAKLPFKKIFKGPQWGINQEVYDALSELEYTCVYTHLEYIDLARKNKLPSIIYNWNLKDDNTMPPYTNKFIVGHGHTHNVCENGIDQVANKVTQTIKSGIFESVFIDDKDIIENLKI